MPTQPRHPCNHRGCPELTSGRYCPDHERQAAQEYDSLRANATERGYTSIWVRVRGMKLGRHPLCERCLMHGRDVAAALVHHRDRNPRNNHAENIESLCVQCHDAEHKGERWGTGGLRVGQ